MYFHFKKSDIYSVTKHNKVMSLGIKLQISLGIWFPNLPYTFAHVPMKMVCSAGVVIFNKHMPSVIGALHFFFFWVFFFVNTPDHIP